jgi:hypothetical protein
MWELQHLTTLCAFTACYGDSFTLLTYFTFTRSTILFPAHTTLARISYALREPNIRQAPNLLSNILNLESQSLRHTFQSRYKCSLRPTRFSHLQGLAFTTSMPNRFTIYDLKILRRSQERLCWRGTVAIFPIRRQWRQKQSLKRRTPSQHWLGWSLENTSLWTALVHIAHSIKYW